MSEKITPLPWKVGFSDGSGEAYITAEHDVTVVCGADDGWGVSQGVGTAADAAYIVEACNAYPTLTARVKELEEVEELAQIISREFGSMDWGLRDTLWDRLAHALNKATLNKEPTK